MIKTVRVYYDKIQLFEAYKFLKEHNRFAPQTPEKFVEIVRGWVTSMLEGDHWYIYSFGLFVHLAEDDGTYEVSFLVDPRVGKPFNDNDLTYASVAYESPNENQPEQQGYLIL